MRLALLLMALAASSAWAAPVKVWKGDGTGGGFWSNPTAWVGNVAPVNGDRLSFPFSSVFSSNDIVGLVLDGLDLDTGPTLQGVGVTLTNTAAITAFGHAQLALPLDLPAGASISPVPGKVNVPNGTQLRLDSVMTLNGGTFSVLMPQAQIILSGQIVENSPTSVFVNAHELDTTTAVRIATTGDFTFSGSEMSGFEANEVGMGIGTSPVIVAGDTRCEIATQASLTRALDLRMAGSSAFFTYTTPSGDTQELASAIALSGMQPMAFQKDTVLSGTITGSGGIKLLGSSNSVTLSHRGNSFSGGLDLLFPSHVIAGDGDVLGTGDVSIGTANGIASILDIRVHDQTTKRLSCSGTFAVTAGAHLTADGVSLSGCVLDLAVPSKFSAGTFDIPIVVNRGVTSGTFRDLPELATISVNGAPHYITYRGGAGNDIVLLATLPGTSPGGGIAAPLIQDMWWGGPAENGWGMSVVQHGDELFIVIFAYDAAGRPTWWVVPTGTWDAQFRKYTGAIYSPHGSPYFNYSASQFGAGPALGTLTLTLTDVSNASLEFSMNGVAGRKAVTRQPFARNPKSHADLGDMWWGGTSQNGWGVAVMQQFETLFIVWFTYDANGAPTWYVMPGGDWNKAKPEAYGGTLYRTTGAAYLGHEYDPSQLKVFEAGPVVFDFSAGSSAIMTYTVDGHSANVTLVREPF